jgi:HAD superfamily hydrolase (TIGR01490 family)
MTRDRAAFFDVDDTLITIKSMFRFLQYDIAASDRPPSDYTRAMAELRALKARGAPRQETNRAFYRNFTGRDEAQLGVRGAEWFRSEYLRGGVFNKRVLTTLRRHHRAGEVIVLVSGSFPPCLDPIAAFVCADLVLCSRPQVREGRYTGDLAVPMVGERKAAAVRAEAAARGIALEHSLAYGDHLSDLPLLDLVGHPVVVGDDPSLRDLAIRRGWTRWPDVLTRQG